MARPQSGGTTVRTCRADEVKVFEVKPRGNGFRVRWRLGTTDKQKSFDRKTGAQRFSRELHAAIDKGSAFDLSSGLPVVWEQNSDMPVHEWLRTWFMEKWPELAGKSRLSYVEMIVDAVEHLVSKPSPANADIRKWAKKVVCRRPGTEIEPGSISPEVAKAEIHVDRWGLTLAELQDPAVAQGLWNRLGQKMNGELGGENAARRRRGLANAAVAEAVKQGRLERNPFDTVIKSRSHVSRKTAPKRLPATQSVRHLIKEVATSGPIGERAEAYLLTMLLSGCRVSEALALTPADVVQGEGGAVLLISKALPRASVDVTDDNEAWDSRDRTKWRDKGEVRKVKIPAELKDVIAAHVKKYRVGRNDRMFSTRKGAPIAAALSPAWASARETIFGRESEYHGFRPYDLRHVHATALIENGMPRARIATRLGHSVEMLMSVYEGVTDLGDGSEWDDVTGALA